MARRIGWTPRWWTEWWTEFAVEHPRTAQWLHGFHAFLPPLNFITIHYAYFVAVTLVTSIIFWASSKPAKSISYADSLFLTVSAMTEAGLNTVNLSQMSTGQQILLCLLILFGGAIWVSIWTVAFRLHAFENRFRDIVKVEREKRDRVRLDRPGSSSCLNVPFFRTVSFGKAKTTPAGDPTFATVLGQKMVANGSSLDTDAAPSIDRRTASLSNLNEMDQTRQSGTMEQQEDRIELQNMAQLSANARVTFANNAPVPGARDARDARDTRTASSVYAMDNRLRRRNIDAAESEQRRPGTPASHTHNFLTNKTVGRNAQFHGLTGEEREHLGGCEYRALKVLSVVVPLYFVLWQFLGCISLGAWIAYNKPEDAIANGLDPWWTGIFFGASAFNNSGMALLDANVIPFQNSYFVLIVVGAMILAGNTAYPIFLRFIFWSMLKVLGWTTMDETLCDLKETLKFILKYPRRVYTNMFPARQTWWLLFMVILLNVSDWVAFELLNIGNPVIEAIPVGPRIINGLFQAIAVRSGGFYIISISEVYIGLQILYLIMMYISVYPVVITMRHSNVYEERSLGIYADDADREYDDPELSDGLQREPTSNSTISAQHHKTTTAARLSRAIRRHLSMHGVGVAPQARKPGENESRISFISQQVHGQLAHDIWWLVLAILVISIIETRHFLEDPMTYSVFNIIFEVVSAYGTVGISIGLPTAAYSFSGGWYTGSKLVLCLVMLRGRHRGLPVALDRAVRLPGEQLHREEEEDYRIRRSRTSRRMSIESHGQ